MGSDGVSGIKSIKEQRGLFWFRSLLQQNLTRANACHSKAILVDIVAPVELPAS
jgi:hypothetical protein